MQLTGDSEGIGELKRLHGENRGYLKFLLDEAKSNTDLTAEFTGKNGVHYKVVLDPRTGDVNVSPA